MKKVKIMVFGTFDGVHKGHLDFFKQAKKITENSFLIVSIARDKNVLKIKGSSPALKELDRLDLVKKTKFANKVVLASKTNYLANILKEKPDIVALGYDQKYYVSELRKDLKNKRILTRIIRLKPYKKNIYKNHLLKNKIYEWMISFNVRLKYIPKVKIKPRIRKRYRWLKKLSKIVAKIGEIIKEKGKIFLKKLINSGSLGLIFLKK